MRPLVRTLILISSLALASCASLRPSHPARGTDLASSLERCAKLSRDSEIEHIFAILCGGIGTAGAGVAPALSGNQIAQDSVLAGAGVFALVGTVLSYAGGVTEAKYSHEGCQ